MAQNAHMQNKKQGILSAQKTSGRNGQQHIYNTYNTVHSVNKKPFQKSSALAQQSPDQTGGLINRLH